MPTLQKLPATPARPPETLWFSAGGGTPPQLQPFFEPADFEWTAGLMANWQVIREETDAYLASNQKLTPYFNEALVSEPNKWKAFGFRFWKMSRSCAVVCPGTMEVLSHIPNLVSASVSIMESDTTIKPHFGDTNAVYRCHLGLKVPASLPDCGFKVGDETRPWEEGGLLIFNDSQMHTAWNHTDQRRYVLLFDVMKPEFVKRTNRICAQVWADLVVMQALPKKYPRFARLPGKLKRLAYYLAIPLVWAVLAGRREK